MENEVEEKQAQRLEYHRKAGRISGEALKFGAELIKEGASLLDVTERIESLIFERGARPAFPVNIAINDVAAHFTPRHDDADLVFTRGDLVKLDVGAHIKGYIGDTAMTVEVGTRNWNDMIKAAREALEVAIEMMRPGVELNKIGTAVEQTIKSFGFRPIRNLTGHGLKKYKLHGGPSVPSVPDKSKDVIKEDTFVAIEPFATNGAGEVDGKKNSNIYSFVRKRSFLTSREASHLQKEIVSSFGPLPFAERWCAKVSKKPHTALRTLSKAGAITFYPILREIDEGMVTQAEHTVHVTSDGCEVLTVPN